MLGFWATKWAQHWLSEIWSYCRICGAKNGLAYKNGVNAMGPDCWAAGWGYLQDESKQTGDQNEYLPNILQSVDIKIFSTSYCVRTSNYAKYDIDEKSQFCGGHDDGTRDTCQGNLPTFLLLQSMTSNCHTFFSKLSHFPKLSHFFQLVTRFFPNCHTFFPNCHIFFPNCHIFSKSSHFFPFCFIIVQKWYLLFKCSNLSHFFCDNLISWTVLYLLTTVSETKLSAHYFTPIFK